ncbi:DUF418 domain-containing protein [Sphingomonas sp. HITSZ_GF]|uniref:DUF418 domain-containing protein n=1 Tax=Sphingomonas sp. HITSZ_GF TaxID=3037247 RepID=UPI00240E3CAB|nr:DUF418 domain-containing protein [Sphingomonas sp. HITSZ_GF]MDG2532426.1 DUF418 domain-containing protein [Sphingomonas sp. HITSZ_GF]
MTSETGAAFAPVTGKARIDVLDMLRGLAILGIFFMNIPFMGAQTSKLFLDPRLIGWGPLDQASWWGIQVVLEGTQRGLLEMLFGAGLMVFARAAMQPDGPVAVADLYIRRNLWLLAFGVFDIFVLLWAGDILHVYALAALLLFPFRRVAAKWLLLLGMCFALYTAGTGAWRYVERTNLVERAQVAERKIAAHQPVTAAEKKALEEWRKKVEKLRTGGEEIKGIAAMEAKGHSGSFLAYAGMQIGFYLMFVWPELLRTVAEAFCMMLVGMALWKWGVIQGQRSARFYLLLMLACYLPGMALRVVAGFEFLSNVPGPKILWMTQEFARMAVSVGHVALINLAVKGAAGRAILNPFKAAGRMAFSLYFMQQILGIYILYAPWGPNLWGRQSWSDMAGTVLLVIAGQVVFANLWLRVFAAGPLEWLWRSLAYVRWQPFRKRPGPAEQLPAEPALA